MKKAFRFYREKYPEMPTANLSTDVLIIRREASNARPNGLLFIPSRRMEKIRMTQTKTRISYRRRREAVISRSFNSLSTHYTDYTRWAGRKNINRPALSLSNPFHLP